MRKSAARSRLQETDTVAGGGSNGSAGIATLNVEAAVEAWLVVVVAALSCQSSRKRCRRRRCSPSLLRVQLLNSWCAKRVWRRACMLVVVRRRLVVGRHSAEGASPPSLHRGRSFAWRFNVASSSSFRLHLREICKSLGTQRGRLLDIRSVSSLLRSRPSSLVDRYPHPVATAQPTAKTPSLVSFFGPAPPLTPAGLVRVVVAVMRTRARVRGRTWVLESHLESQGAL